MKSDLPVLPSTASIQEAIRRLEEMSAATAFVVDETRIFVGQVTIQQLRRLILSGADSASRIASYAAWNTAKIAKSELDDEAALAALAEDMELQGIDAAPIVNKNDKVVGSLGLADIRKRLSHGRTPKSRAAELRTKNVLVVGGAGYLGSVLVRKLIQTERRVRVLDSFIYGKRSLQPLEGHRNLEIVEGDFRNIETVVNSLKDIDAVVLLAAVVGDPAAQHRPEQTIETNILAAQSLAFACKLHCISRFVFASTCSVYGRTDSVLDEASPLNPVSLYARSKIFSEKCVLDLAGDNFSPTILRMGTLYGYSPRMRFDLVVNTMSMKAHVEKRIQVFGGSQWRPLLHVEDAADAFARCLDAPLEKIGNQIFNVGSNEQNYRIIEIADLIGAALKKVTIEVEDAQLDARDYRVSFDKIRRALGFKAEETIPRAAKRIDRELSLGNLRNPYAKVYYNHYFDAAEES
jgi:nucleoside-diphosphate-sugar epimerase/predicted transcriptional regulator